MLEITSMSLKRNRGLHNVKKSINYIMMEAEKWRYQRWGTKVRAQGQREGDPGFSMKKSSLHKYFVDEQYNNIFVVLLL